MASFITIATGPLSSTKNYANDAKVQTTLLKFWESRLQHEGEPEPSNQEKLDAIVDEIETMIRDEVRNNERNKRVEAAIPGILADIDNDYGLE